MPAKSKAQQRLFGMVHAYQKGKMKNASSKVKRLAKHISPDSATHYASTSHEKLSEMLYSVLNSPAYIEDTLKEIIATGEPDYIRGKLVDVYTATMLMTVADKLNEANKNRLFSQTINEMVAVAYKVLTY